jgi:hypothetical protein
LVQIDGTVQNSTFLIFKCKFVFTLYAKALMVMMIARIAAVERSSGIAINIGLVLIFG